VIFSWVQREYRNLLIAREVIDVPTPHTFKNNVLVMEMIGDYEPALQLKDSIPENLEEFFNEIIDSIKKLFKKGLVHADLSAFNILNYKERPYFIDFSQGTSTQNPNAKELLQRDIRNICNFFKKNGLKINPEEIYEKIVKDESNFN
jgi:RIO kinase 1